MVRTPLAADDSLAAIRARSRFGMAMAAMIRMIATTISNSISEKPFCFRISLFPHLHVQNLVGKLTTAGIVALCSPKPKVTEVFQRPRSAPLFSMVGNLRRSAGLGDGALLCQETLPQFVKAKGASDCSDAPAACTLPQVRAELFNCFWAIYF